MAQPTTFYHDWEGEDWWPINVDDGTTEQPHDFEFWLYCKEHGAPSREGESQGLSADMLKACECSICKHTLFMPVVTLCMHVFCYSCLHDWFTIGRVVCPLCVRPVDQTPIRDNALEMRVADAISSGALEKSPFQPGKNVAVGNNDYNWAAFNFIGDM
ncbi:hypothetical protein C8F04DRAFT_1273760 [Mycena alexandri]|uniref:RING-type domain-containing protein n=1 Tax=Mycena alexandri TaxID=1745969 RepID=A0AAD6S5A7_9AGAR|nr:hypothetical protein C8F04DRAFT_1273760 [Mycena alexandri]